MAQALEPALAQVCQRFGIPQKKIIGVIFPKNIHWGEVDYYGCPKVLDFIKQKSGQVNSFEMDELTEVVTGNVTIRQAERFDIEHVEGQDAGKVIISYARCK